MKIDCTSNNGKPCLNCEAYMAGVAECERLRAEVARSQHELVKAGRTIVVYRKGYDEMCSALGASADPDPDPVEIAKGLRAEVERLRGECREAARVLTRYDGDSPSVDQVILRLRKVGQ